jgi:hypothetical protein
MSPYKIRYLGSFEVLAPSGLPLDVPTRRAKALFAMLAAAAPNGLSRSEIADSLWPTNPPTSRQASLRQELATLRRAVGYSSIETTSANIRLAGQLDVETDLSQPGSDPFMPGFEGPWFDAMRLERMPTPLTEEPPESVTRSLTHLLEWQSDSDPDQMLECMRANIDLCFGIPADTLARLVHRAERPGRGKPRLPGWIRFWQGYVLLSTHVRSARVHFHHAASEGLEHRDYVLACEAAFWGGCCDSLLGRFRAAADLAQAGREIADGLSSPALRAKAASLAGITALHVGRHEDAIVALQEASALMQTGSLQWAQNEALSGLYEACAGRLSEAHCRLEAPRRIAATCRDERVVILCDLADAYLLLSSHEWESAGGRFGAIIQTGKRVGSRHWEIYGHEGACVSRFQVGDKDAAREHMKASRSLRQEIQMRYSEWDRMRLSPAARAVVQSA